MTETEKKYYAGIGSRKTPAHICNFMTRIAKSMRENGYILRSGGAVGADTAFENGAGDKKEIWLPYIGFNKNPSKLLPSKAAFEMAAKYHPKWDELDNSSRQFHARNCHQVLGADLKTPVISIFCWTEDGKGGGGTGQALRIAKAYKIPVFDLGVESMYRTLAGSDISNILEFN